MGFPERTLAERKRLERIVSRGDIARELLDLDPERQVLEIDHIMVPGTFWPRQMLLDGAEPRLIEGAKQWYKRGRSLRLRQPRTYGDALGQQKTMQDRVKAVPIALERMSQDEAGKVLGYGWFPVERTRANWAGDVRTAPRMDTRWRLMPFYSVLEGARWYALAKPRVVVYDHVLAVGKVGAEVKVTLASRSGTESYSSDLACVPVRDTPEQLVVALDCGPKSQALDARGVYPQRRYRFGFPDPARLAQTTHPDRGEISDFDKMLALRFFESDVAGLLGALDARPDNATLRSQHPLLLPSEELIQIYLRARNNVICRDPTYRTKDRLRKPYVPELCSFLSLGQRLLGAGALTNDPASIATYDWHLPGAPALSGKSI